MFKKIFKKKENLKEENNNSILIAALLVHAAKMDENYTGVEQNIIKESLIKLFNIKPEEANKLLIMAEKKEEQSNQILEFTKEIKKQDINYRLQIIETLWKIIFSDKSEDMYESNLMRRICGLLYVSDADNGKIKEKIKLLNK
tara:strand:+ start:6452 stop:6880 length:429 start_codon:yes stop_codon:yes gene_type:complete